MTTTVPKSDGKARSTRSFCHGLLDNCFVKLVYVLLIFMLCGCGKGNSSFDGTSREIEIARKQHAETLAAQTANKKSLGHERVPVTFDATMEAGDQLQSGGETARALWTYLQALDLEPDAIEPRTRIGLLHLKDDPDRAAAVFSEVLERVPDSGAAHFGLGLAFVARGDHDEAFRELLRADELLPDTAMILAARGSLDEQMGKRESALILLRQAYDLNPTDRDILNNLGVTLLLDDQIAESTRLLERATLLYPDDTVLQNNLGLAYGLADDYERAFRAFSKSGDERSARNNLGYVYFLNGRLDEALAAYETALLAEGSDPMIVLRNIEATLAVQSKSGPASVAD
jgi:Flp pilus assembly protein TadD